VAGAEAGMASGRVACSIGFNSASASFIPVRLNERHGFRGLRKKSAPRRKAIPQGLKPSSAALGTARLKPCPDTGH
jgi:hypothetical protein